MKKWDRIVMLAIIIILLGIICVLLFNKQQSNTQSSIFEKKKMCVEMRKSYEDYVKKTWNIEKDGGGYFQTVGDVDIFFNSERNSCLGAFYMYGNMGSIDKQVTSVYSIYDYMNGNEELFSCSTINNHNCMTMWEEKKVELGK